MNRKIIILTIIGLIVGRMMTLLLHRRGPLLDSCRRNLVREVCGVGLPDCGTCRENKIRGDSLCTEDVRLPDPRYQQ
jgi:hypothetical protein